MDNRKWTSGASDTPPDVPISLETGYPSPGNPALGVSPTTGGAYWFHQVGEEIRSVLVAAGLTPNHTDLGQLNEAIQRLILSGQYKQSCRFTTTGDVALTGLGTQAGGDWGAALTAGDRILVKNNAVGSQDGPYIAAAGAWSRAIDADTGSELGGGTLIPVEEGTVYADTVWMLVNDGNVTIGTTGLVFQLESTTKLVSVLNFGADPTGISSAVTAFQSAISATPDSGTQCIRVPRGSYLGDMTTLDYGNRTIVWQEDAGVAYLTAFPRQTRSDIRSLSPMLFNGSVEPSMHLKQFSSRFASAGYGFVAGAVTITTGAPTSMVITSGGAAYSAPRVLVTGDGTGATATATVAGGVVTAITFSGGSGYTTVSVYVVEGPVVVVAGDSISTEGPDPFIPSETQYSVIKKAILQQNPKRNITFFNRAVGAQTWTTFNDVANANWPTWYSNHAKAWLDYIKELQPDLVIIALGMNDRQNFVPAQMRAAITTILGFSTVPDIVFVTPMVPSAISNNADISSFASQTGRDLVAGYERGYALENNYGLIDLHRQSRLVRDGTDVRQTYLREVTIAGAQAMPWISTEQGEGYYSKATFATNAAGFWTARAIEFLISPLGANLTQYLSITNSGGSLVIAVEEYSGGGVPYNPKVSTFATGYPTPNAAATEFEVTISDQWIEVAVDGNVLVSSTIARAGGQFYPAIRRIDITDPALPVSVSDATATVVFAVGEYAMYNSRLTDYELWGYGAGNEYKGNALNHPTALCVKHVIAPVFSNSDWHRAAALNGTTSNGVTTNTGINEPNPVARQHITKTGFSSTLTPSANANNQVLEDATNVGQSLLSGPTGVARWVAGDDGNASQFVMSYNHNTDTLTITIGGVNLLTLTGAKEAKTVPAGVPSYTVAGLPSATGTPALIFVSNEVGGAVLAFSDGTNWRRVTDRAIVS